MNTELPAKIQEEVASAQIDATAQNRECPHCHSHRIESVGFRDVTETVRRFRCKECGKTHSRDAKTNELHSVPEIQKKPATRQTIKQVNVTPRTHERLMNMKIIDAESMNNVIERLLDEHYGKIKVK